MQDQLKKNPSEWAPIDGIYRQNDGLHPLFGRQISTAEAESLTVQKGNKYVVEAAPGLDRGIRRVRGQGLSLLQSGDGRRIATPQPGRPRQRHQPLQCPNEVEGGRIQHSTHKALSDRKGIEVAMSTWMHTLYKWCVNCWSLECRLLSSRAHV